MAANLTFDGSTRTVTAIWDELSQPYAALLSHTLWPIELVDSTTGLPKRTRFSVPGYGTGLYYRAPTCLSSLAPASYGTLAAAITTTTATSISIAATSLPAPPFPITVASNVAGDGSGADAGDVL